MFTTICGARGGALLRGGRLWRDAAVGGVGDERRPVLPVHARQRRASIPPELVVGAADVAVGIAGVAVVAIVPLQCPLRQRGRFGIGEKLPAGEFRGTLERCQRGKAPDALQIWMAIDRNGGFGDASRR